MSKLASWFISFLACKVAESLLCRTTNISLSWSFVPCLRRTISVTQMFTHWSRFLDLRNHFLLMTRDPNDNHTWSALDWSWPPSKTFKTFRNLDLHSYSDTQLVTAPVYKLLCRRKLRHPNQLLRRFQISHHIRL